MKSEDLFGLLLRSHEPASSRDPEPNERFHCFVSHISKLQFAIILRFMPMSLKCAYSLLIFFIYFSFLLLLNIYHEESISSKLFNYFMLVSCLAYSSVLKMEATCSSETSVDSQWTTRRCISEERTLLNHSCQNLKSCNER
jgi:hypothetical protein